MTSVFRSDTRSRCVPRIQFPNFEFIKEIGAGIGLKALLWRIFTRGAVKHTIDGRMSELRLRKGCHMSGSTFYASIRRPNSVESVISRFLTSAEIVLAWSRPRLKFICACRPVASASRREPQRYPFRPLWMTREQVRDCPVSFLRALFGSFLPEETRCTVK